MGIWSLAVGIMALRVHFERPASTSEIELEVARMGSTAAIQGEEPTAVAGARLLAHRRLDAVRRVRFHVAAWLLGMVVGTPLWALIE